MNGSWVTAFATGALIGAVLTRLLARCGLPLLAGDHAAARRLLSASTITGCAAGITALAASRHAGGWWVAPALMLWACALAAAATCDALTQRIPTSLVRQAGVATGVLLVAGLSPHHDWRGLAISAAASAVAGLVLMLCWRMAGVGFGDVRLGVLGGLGLGHASLQGVEIAVVALCVLILIQLVVTLARTGNRRTMVAFGPALALSFVLAATL